MKLFSKFAKLLNEETCPGLLERNSTMIREDVLARNKLALAETIQACLNTLHVGRNSEILVPLMPSLSQLTVLNKQRNAPVLRSSHSAFRPLLRSASILVVTIVTPLAAKD